MKTTQDIQQELLKLLPESKVEVIKALKKYFPRNSEIYKQAVLHEARVKSLRRKENLGTIAPEDVQIEENKIRVSLMEIITSIGKMDSTKSSSPNKKLAIWGTFIFLFAAGLFIGWKYFAEPTPTTNNTNLPKNLLSTSNDTIKRSLKAEIPDAKSGKGKILYSVPSRMELNKITRCTIRIAQEDMSTLSFVEGVSSETPIQIEAIRIGDVMTANIDNASDDNAFKINPLSTDEQIIEKDFFTEWLFLITPLKEGIHSLSVRVTIKVKSEELGKITDKVIKVFDKEIEVLTEEIPQGEPVFESGGNVQLAALESPSESENKPQKNTATDNIIETIEPNKPETTIKKDEEITQKPEPKTGNNTTKSTKSNTGNGTLQSKPNVVSKGTIPKFATVGGDLEKRIVKSAPSIRTKITKSGRIVLKVCVDKKGNVISSKFILLGSTSIDAKLKKIAIENSKKWKFGGSFAKKQCGTIAYNFKE